jgi:hypothetical protein
MIEESCKFTVFEANPFGFTQKRIKSERAVIEGEVNQAMIIDKVNAENEMEQSSLMNPELHEKVQEYSLPNSE